VANDYNALVTRIQGLVLDTPAFLVGDIPNYISAAQLRMEDEATIRGMRGLAGPYTTTQNVRTLVAIPSQVFAGPWWNPNNLPYSKPANWLRLREAPYWYDGLGKVTWISWINTEEERDHRWNYLDPTETGSPVQLFDQDTSFEVYPLPDQNCVVGTAPLADGSGPITDGNYRIMIPYWARLQPLGPANETPVVTTLTNFWTVNAWDYLAWYAVAEGFQLLQSPMAAEWMGKAVAEKRRLLRKWSIDKLPDSFQMGYRTGGRAPYGSGNQSGGGWGQGFPPAGGPPTGPVGP